MKKVILTLGLPFFYCSAAFAFEAPKPDDLKPIAHHIPENWQTIALASGDMNKDKQTDYAVVIQATNKEKIIKEDEYTPELDSNPKQLLIIWGSKDGTSQLAYTDQSIIPTRDPEIPNMMEPFQSISISKKGVLTVHHQIFMSMGGWEMQNMHFLFRYQDKALKLIGYDHETMHRASGMFEKNSYNLLTQKQQTVSGSMSNPKHKEKWQTFTPRKTWRLGNITSPLEFAP